MIKILFCTTLISMALKAAIVIYDRQWRKANAAFVKEMLHENKDRVFHFAGYTKIWNISTAIFWGGIVIAATWGVVQRL